MIDRCAVCKKITYGPGHKCDPQWLCWFEDMASVVERLGGKLISTTIEPGDTDGLKMNGAYTLRAENSKEAAEAFCSEYDASDSTFEGDVRVVYVRPLADEEAAPEVFEVEGELIPDYHASKRSEAVRP